VSSSIIIGKELDRKTRFWLGFMFLVSIFSIPIAGFAYAGWFWGLVIVFAVFALSVYIVYRFTIKNIKLKYPIVNPEGQADIYSGRMPRPIYEDMQRYPWFFKKKKNKKKIDNQQKNRKKR
jgi:hypothetical protein